MVAWGFFSSGWDIIRNSVSDEFLTQELSEQILQEVSVCQILNHCGLKIIIVSPVILLVRIFVAVFTFVVLRDDTDFLPLCKRTK